MKKIQNGGKNLKDKMENILKKKIQEKEAKIGIIGLGYVGLPLAVEFAKKGFDVVGIDVDKTKVASLKQKRSYILDVTSEDVRAVVSAGLFYATTDYGAIKKLDAVIICVPTPLRKTKEPDISYIISAAEQIAANSKKGQLVILESTTYPGTTEEVVLPILGKSGMNIDKDFFLAFSPERVDPGNLKFKTRDIPKIVGGVTKKSSDLAKTLYSQVMKEVLTVSSSKAAEMVKLLENTFRSVNIGLVNEIALMSNKLGINVWEVIDAAKTKPFGFMPFYPGPGLGGHCIPIDPLYLSWKARAYGFEARFIELADMVNSYMPEYVVKRIGEILNGFKKSLLGSKVLIVGVTYKRDVNDMRESPAMEIIRDLMKKGVTVSYFDPYAPRINIDGKTLYSTKWKPAIFKKEDCVVIITDHSSIDYEEILKNSKMVFDTRNIYKNIEAKNLVRL
ncbi:MAG: nucleotide sugar dehydrogenase [Candidatus Omnitrophica bacterium]|nr:nucleotide sugar dehydrogenase [Candidatus Omnitrophota bacterium]